MTTEEIKSFIDGLLHNKSDREKVKILRSCFEDHALGHPWADDDLVQSIIDNISNQYGKKS